MNNMPYFTMKVSEKKDVVDIYIFGDITPWKWDESDTTAYDLATQIKDLPEDAAITVHINSNGGDLKEGLGIYNVLKGRDVTTICEGFAASSASVIFCAGKNRIMNAASLLFIHNASTWAAGTAEDFEKAADDLKIITNAAKAAYREAGVNVSDKELDRMMDEETWLTPQDAIDMGFATAILEADDDGIKNDAMQSIMKAVTGQRVQMEILHYEDLMDEVKRYIDARIAALDFAEEPKDEPEGEPVEEATNTTPISPALVEDKGFFGFRKG